MTSHVSELLQIDTNSESDDTSLSDQDVDSVKQYHSGRDTIPESLIRLGPPQQRTSRDIEWTSCLIHRQTNSKCGKSEAWTVTSWDRFCNAARERQDEIYDSLKDYIDGSKPLPVTLQQLVKHHNCYASYVLPKSVKLAKEARLKDARSYVSDEVVPSTSGESVQASQTADSMKTRSNVEKTKLGKCIICQRDKRHPTKRWRLEVAHRFTQKDSGKTLLQAARQRGGERLIRAIGGGARAGEDVIAGDILVHDTCRRKYVAQRNVRYSTSVQHSDSCYAKAFQRLAKYIQTHVIDGNDVLHLSDLRDEMIDILREDYAVDAPGYRNQSLKTRLQQEFGDQIAFWYPNKWRQESELVFSNEIPTGMVLEVGVAATKALQDQEDDDIQVHIKLIVCAFMSYVTRVINNSLMQAK